MTGSLAQSVLQAEWSARVKTTPGGIRAGNLTLQSPHSASWHTTSMWRPLGAGGLLAIITLIAYASAAGTPDLTAVFAPPTAGELATVRAEWAARFPTPINYQVVASFADGNGRVVQVVRHDIEPAGVHYAAIRLPAAFNPNRTYPVVFCLHGGNAGVSLAIFGAHDNLAGTGSDPCAGREAILVAPSYRCEPLIAGQLGTFLSTGVCTEEDHEVDDVIALVGGVLANIPAADEEHVVAWGTSHGGSILLGLLARDPRVRAGIDFYGAADVFQSSSQAEAEALVAAGECELPESWRLTVCDYVEGTQTLEATRINLLRHSRGHFVDQMSRLDVHHGTLDPKIDVIQSHMLVEHAAASSPPLATFRFFEYPTGVHSLSSLSGHQSRAREFLCAAFNMQPRRPGDINEDGVVDGVDLSFFFTDWGTMTATSRADLNADHTVGAADLAILLGAWGG